MSTFRRRRGAHAVQILRAAAFGAPALLAASLLSPAARADLSWDPGMTGPAVSGGTNTWDTTSNFWWNGTVDTTWTDGNAATFAGAAGVVTLAAPRSATGLTFGTTGYTLTGSALTLTTPATVSVGAAISATINSNVAGTDGLSVSSGGTLILNNNNAGLLSGNVNVIGPGTVLAGGAGTTSAFGDGAISTTNTPVIAGGDGAIIGNNLSSDGGGVILRGLVGAAIPAGGGTGVGDRVTYSGVISGGPVTISHPGALFTTTVLTNTANSWTGGTTVDTAMLVIGANNVLPTDTILTLSQAGTVSQLHVPGGRTQQIGKLLGNGAVTLNGTLKMGFASNNNASPDNCGATFYDPAGTGILEKTNSNTVNLQTASGANFKGQVKITGGFLRADTAAYLGDNSPTNIVTFDGGGYQWGNSSTWTRPVVIGPGGGSLDSSSNSNRLTFSGGILSGTGAIQKYAKATVVLNGDNPSFSGAWNLGTIGLPGNSWQTSYPAVNNVAALVLTSTNCAGNGSATNIITLQEAGKIDINPGTTVSIPQHIVIAGTAALPSDIRTGNPSSSLLPSTQLTLNGQITGSGVLELGQKENTTFHNTTSPFVPNTFSGPIYLKGDTVTLTVFSDNDLGDNSGANVNINVIYMTDFSPGSGFSAGGGNNSATLKLAGDVTGNHNLFLGFNGAGTGSNIIDTQGFNGRFAKIANGTGAGKMTKLGTGDLTIDSMRGLGDVAVNAGKLVLAPNGQAPGVSVVNTLAVTAAKLDIKDNHLIVHASPVGTLDNTANTYTGLTGLIQSGRNGGGWTGTGIVTSQTDATTSNLTSIGIATAQQVKGLANPGDTAVWAGQTVTGSDALVMYTYGGDANLDGKLNVDDYGHIDSSIGIGLTGWFNGDFNYDGKINVDDYGIIDFNIGIQGAPFSAGAGAAGLSAAAVPEPAAAGVASLAIGLLAHRRRRRS